MSDIKKFFKADDAAHKGIYHIEFLANAFSITGNKEVSKELCEIANGLRKNIEEMRKLFDEELRRSVEVAEQNSANVLNGVLAGIRLKEKDDTKY